MVLRPTLVMMVLSTVYNALQWERLSLEMFAGRVSMLGTSANEGGSAQIQLVGKACHRAATALLTSSATVVL